MFNNILVYSKTLDPVEDYIDSLNIFHSIVEFNHMSIECLSKPENLFFFTQMWFVPVFKNSGFPLSECVSRLLFINVEILTEQNRLNHIHEIINTGVKVLDYSLTNILIMKRLIETNSIQYPHNIYHLPYQFNQCEKKHIEHTSCDVVYEYDAGIINAFPKTDLGNTSRRTNIFEQLSEEPGIKCLNIVGWGRTRDREIQKCRIIVNVHHFDSFLVFEDIRCARLIFANKLIVSEKNINNELVDLKDFIHWSEYDNILATVKHILANFDHYQTQLINQSKH